VPKTVGWVVLTREVGVPIEGVIVVVVVATAVVSAANAGVATVSRPHATAVATQVFLRIANPAYSARVSTLLRPRG
jgi:L-asparagine transporter-like permease